MKELAMDIIKMNKRGVLAKAEKVKDSTHKSKNAAVAAWRRFCN